MIEYTVRVEGEKTEWFFEGKRHRLDGPAVEHADGSKEWWFDGNLHRLDGPAIEDSDGGKSWWVNGKLHRLDGPAIECASGSKLWYVNGKELSEAEFNRLGNVKELSVKEIEALLGYSIKVVKG